jgi:hypothetical protein
MIQHPGRCVRFDPGMVKHFPLPSQLVGHVSRCIFGVCQHPPSLHEGVQSGIGIWLHPFVPTYHPDTASGATVTAPVLGTALL